jgi:flavin-dependent dehydrogenase
VGSYRIAVVGAGGAGATAAILLEGVAVSGPLGAGISR